jgi:LTXXQ motif family protein
MLRTMAGVGGVLLLFATPGYGQDKAAPTPMQQEGGLSQADLNALTDTRVAGLKAALQLTPEQSKLWPALEEAMRARATGRQQRLMALAAKLNSPGEMDPVGLIRERADNLIARGTDLKKLADAWQPLSQTLSPEQKGRMRIFAVHFLHLVRGAVEERQMLMEEEGTD